MSAPRAPRQTPLCRLLRRGKGAAPGVSGDTSRLALLARRWTPWLDPDAVVPSALRLELLTRQTGAGLLRPLALAAAWGVTADRLLAATAVALDTGRVSAWWLQSCPRCDQPAAGHAALASLAPPLVCPSCSACSRVVLDRDLELVVSAIDAARVLVPCPPNQRDRQLDAGRFFTCHALRQARPDDLLPAGEAFDGGTIAVLFADLVGSTALYAERGDAGAYGLVMRQFEVLDGIVQRLGGVRVESIGDAVMAAFADPADAVEAAALVQQALCDDPRTDQLQLRVGVHAGPCLAGAVQGVHDLFGGTVNVAARLDRQAPAGGVALSQASVSAGGASARIDALPDRVRRTHETRLKGLGGSWRVTCVAWTPGQETRAA